MENNVLITIGIPTYNRCAHIANLLSAILPQVEQMAGLVNVCISNNGSVDDTGRIIGDFVRQYPGLIAYRENPTNIGHDKNILKVMEASGGKFLWLLGDDDMVLLGGVRKVADLVKSQPEEQTGFIMLSHRAYFIDSTTGQEVTHVTSFQKDKPRVYDLAMKDILGIRSNNSFISTLVFNNYMLKKTIRKEGRLVAKAMDNYYIHTFLYQLMLLKYPYLRALKYNEIIIAEDVHPYKSFIEDRFKMYYVVRNRLDALLLTSGYATKEHQKILVLQQKKLLRSTIREMAVLKAFGNFKYASFLGCIALFYREAKPVEALVLSMFFMIFLVIPAFLIRGFYKLFIRLKYGQQWAEIWLSVVVGGSMVTSGVQRRWT